MNNELGNIIKQNRLKKDMSQQELANASSISKSYINKIEHNQSKKPSIDVLHNISIVLGIDFINLIEIAGYDIEDAYINENLINEFIINYELKYYNSKLEQYYINNKKVNINKVIKDYENEIIDYKTALYLYIKWLKEKDISQ